MTKRTMPSRPPREHLSHDLIGQYLYGKLPERTRNRVERHLLDCDFCSDALEGYTSRPDTATRHLDDLRQRLDKRVRRFRFVLPFGMQPYAVAASVILLVTCTLAVWLMHFYRTQDTSVPQLSHNTPPAAPVPELAPRVEKSTAVVPRTDIGTGDAPAEKAKKPGIGNATTDRALYSENSGTPAKETEVGQLAPSLEKEMYTASVDDKSIQGAPGITFEREDHQAPARLKRATPPITARGISRRVRGIVTDATTGAPLPGVNITIKGTDTRTLSDAQGNFSLEVPAGSTPLVFNLIGMITQEQDVRTTDFLRVQLGLDAQALNDMVVIGYGEAGNAGSAAPVGGLDEFNRYVKENLRRPDTTRREVVVNLECVVQADGRLSDFVIRKSAGEVYDREAIRVLKEGPRWQPARRRGKAVPKKVTLRIPFKP